MRFYYLNVPRGGPRERFCAVFKTSMREYNELSHCRSSNDNDNEPDDNTSTLISLLPLEGKQSHIVPDPCKRNHNQQNTQTLLTCHENLLNLYTKAGDIVVIY